MGDTINKKKKVFVSVFSPLAFSPKLIYVHLNSLFAVKKMYSKLTRHSCLVSYYYVFGTFTLPSACEILDSFNSSKLYKLLKFNTLRK